MAVAVNILFIEPRLNFVSMWFGTWKRLLASPQARANSNSSPLARSTLPEKASLSQTRSKISVVACTSCDSLIGGSSTLLGVRAGAKRRPPTKYSPDSSNRIRTPRQAPKFSSLTMTTVSSGRSGT